MRIENRELYVTFWDYEDLAGVVALLIGWVGDDPATLRPVVAHNQGVQELDAWGWNLFSNLHYARKHATHMQEPKQ